jgi:hypothetical protein
MMNELTELKAAAAEMVELSVKGNFTAIVTLKNGKKKYGRLVGSNNTGLVLETNSIGKITVEYSSIESTEFKENV